MEKEQQMDDDKHKQQADSDSNVVICPVCGQPYDRSYLAAVFEHLHDPALNPADAANIRGREVPPEAWDAIQ
jgi:hypothetical protein